MDDVWRDGEGAVLKRSGAPPLMITVTPGPQRIGNEGVLDVSEQIGRPPGGELAWLGATYRLLRPSLADLFGSLRRGPQIVTPKDAAYLGYLAGVGPGARIAEAGAGSGALTIALVYAAGPSGHVTSYDRRAEFLETARRNVVRAGSGTGSRSGNAMSPGTGSTSRTSPRSSSTCPSRGRSSRRPTAPSLPGGMPRRSPRRTTSSNGRSVPFAAPDSMTSARSS